MTDDLSDRPPQEPAGIPGFDPGELVERQPVGILVVDGETVVRFANPAAARMLGIPPAQLLDQTFGLPVFAGGVTDINVPNADGSARTLAMTATALGHNRLRLISLFDVTGRTRAYEHEHGLVETLQRSILLDQMPELPGVSLAARYLPGGGDVRFGGDWYDVIPLRDGRVGLVIGDVVGHGIESAALMGQLRNSLRAYALEHPSPATVLSRLDQMLGHLERRGMATTVYLIYSPTNRALTYAAAGHPYPLVAHPDGTTQFLEGARMVPLGTGMVTEGTDETVVLPPGSTLILYTDGLVERRRGPIDHGLNELADRCLDSTWRDPGEACDGILKGMLGGEPPSDDVALLVLQTSPEPSAGLGRPDDPSEGRGAIG